MTLNISKNHFGGVLVPVENDSEPRPVLSERKKHFKILVKMTLNISKNHLLGVLAPVENVSAPRPVLSERKKYFKILVLSAVLLKNPNFHGRCDTAR